MDFQHCDICMKVFTSWMLMERLLLGQAASVEQSDDKLTWTFTLRDDITWSDGQAVTANDFVFGFDNLAAQGGDYCTMISDIVDSYEATDDKTLVTSSETCRAAYLPSVLAFPPTYPARQDYVEEYGDAYATDPDKAVYNGPYEMESWAHESEVVMKLRDDYYDADQHPGWHYQLGTDHRGKLCTCFF